MKCRGGAILVVLALAAPAVESPPAEKAPADRRMAITVDDLPVAQPSRYDDREMERITTDLLATLVRHRVPAVGFVNEGKLEVGGVVDSFRLGLLERWLAAGLELGNHGFAHLDLHRVAPETWMADVVRGESATGRLVEAAGSTLRYFRHPFLHLGTSSEIQAETAAFLAARG